MDYSTTNLIAITVAVCAIIYTFYPWQPTVYGFLAQQLASPTGRFGRSLARPVMLWQDQEGAKWVGEQIPMDMQMLEVGCGSGVVSRVVLDRQTVLPAEQRYLLCIDISGQLIEDTHEQFTIEEANREIFFQKTDFTTSRPRRRTFDVVYTYDVIHVWSELKSKIKIMSQFLLKGGQAWICFKHPDSWPQDEIYRYGEINGIYTKWEIEKVHSLLLKVGFHDVGTKTNLQVDNGKGAVCVYGTYKKRTNK